MKGILSPQGRGLVCRGDKNIIHFLCDNYIDKFGVKNETIQENRPLVDFDK